MGPWGGEAGWGQLLEGAQRKGLRAGLGELKGTVKQWAPSSSPLSPADGHAELQGLSTAPWCTRWRGAGGGQDRQVGKPQREASSLLTSCGPSPVFL